jgi:lysyl-tRNA synthetase class 1
MKIPDWVQQVLSRFEEATEPHMEVELSDALRNAINGYPNLSAEDFKGFQAEWAAFLFHERPDKDSVWNTYFAPMMTVPRQDGTEFRSPDIKDLDAEVVAFWEGRARSVQNPVMRARYADLVWDLKRAITNERPSHEYAQIAIDAYLDATEKRRYTMDIDGVGWLRRALDLSLSLNDHARTARVVATIFEFYGAVAKPQRAGVWVFPFDALYGRKDLLTPGQESKIIADLETMLAKTSGEGSPEEFDPFGAQAAAERLAQHYRRLNDSASVRRVIKTYGQAFERMSKDASPMLATAWLQPVIERYEQEGLKQEAEQLQMESAEKGKNIASEMREVSVTVDIKPEDVERLVQDLTSGDLRTSLLRIAVYFIPKVSETRQLLEKMRTDAPLMSMIRIVRVESDGHPSSIIGPIEEDLEGRLHKQLGDTISFYQPFLARTLTVLRERYSPTVVDISSFLGESPLFPAGGNDLLREGLAAYEREDFVKAIHVLVPQIEHTLRNFLTLIDIPPLKTVKRHPGIMDAKSMNDVLSDDRVRQALTEDLWRYLSVLYIDRRGGLNLRNDLAHGLAGAKAFSRSIADRVFHSLLALSLMRAKQDPQSSGNP